MRTTFVHEARVALDEGGDDRAPGGAVTLELCGSWDHPGPCPVAPHHTAVRSDGDDLVVRVLFACERADEDEVRARVIEGLRRHELVGPDGVRSRWTVVEHHADTVRREEESQSAALVLAP